MAALTADRETSHREQLIHPFPVKAGKKIFAGALVALVAGYAQPALAALGQVAVGRAEFPADNTAGADGDLTVAVRRGVTCWDTAANGADQVTEANVGQTAYMVDDHTVAPNDGGGVRSPAGVIVLVDDDGVWVDVGRQKVGVNKHTLERTVATLVGAGVYRVVSPIAGKLAKIWSVIEGALATGDATLTIAINGVNVTTGVVTITQAGSAAGDIDSAVPTALNTVAKGDVISITVGGTNSAAVAAQVTLEIDT